jgi:transcription initiation factor TFIIIB Brf1 subunit/transcription initiation factor TFIIB
MTKCKECNNDEFEYDERLGEENCTQCGFIRVVNIFEDRPPIHGEEFSESNVNSVTHKSKRLGGYVSHTDRKNKDSQRIYRTDRMFGQRNDKDRALRQGLRECYMVLSYHSQGSEAKRLVRHYYKTLYDNKKMQGFNLNMRACAIVFLVFRDLNIPITANEIAKRHYLKPSHVSRAARKFGKYLGASHKLHSFNTNSWVDKVAGTVDVSRDYIIDLRNVANYVEISLERSQLSMSKTYLAACMWMVVKLRKMNELRQYHVCDACQCTPVALRNAARRIFVSVDSDFEMLDKLTVDEFISGVRI